MLLIFYDDDFFIIQKLACHLRESCLSRCSASTVYLFPSCQIGVTVVEKMLMEMLTDLIRFGPLSSHAHSSSHYSVVTEQYQLTLLVMMMMILYYGTGMKRLELFFCM